MLGVTNKTIINRCAKLVNNGLLILIIVKTRIRSYRLSDFSKTNDKENKKPVVHQYLSRVKDWLCLIDAHIVGELFFIFHNSIIMV